MGNIFNDDFLDFIRCMNEAGVEYILVGGYAVILHGYSRTTGDMDIWVNRTSENYNRLLKAFGKFGMSVFDMTSRRFLYDESVDVFRFGRPPVAIDLMLSVKGLLFGEAYRQAIKSRVGDVEITLLAKTDLIIAKHAAGRPKDKDDLESL